MNNEVYQGEGVRKRIIGAAESLAQKLNREIEKGNDEVAFMIALFLAGLKDFLDIILAVSIVGLIPGVSWGIGLFLTSFLFFFMLGKGWFLRWRIRIWFWVLGLFVDGIPGINVMPMNVLLVLYAWRLAKKRKKEATEKLQELHSMTEAEINALNDNISLLEDYGGHQAEVTTDRRRASQIRERNEAARSKITLIESPKNLRGKAPVTQDLPQVGSQRATITSNKARARKIKEKNEEARSQITFITPRPKPNFDITPKQAPNSEEGDMAA